MLGRMSSLELSEWMAFERQGGPIGSQWRDELLAELHEQVQTLNYMFSQANFTDKQHRKGPAPKPEKFPRPKEAFAPKEDTTE